MVFQKEQGLKNGFYLNIFYNINNKLSKSVMLKCSNKHRNKKDTDGCL